MLTSVIFVMDYVQLDFDGPRLTAVTLPTVEVEGVRLKFGQPGYRDALCERIEHTVVRADAIADESLRIEFDDRSVIGVSLRPEDYRAAEAALLRADSKLAIW
jgi:hypothetical protein